jgi:hypothetical protein
MNTNFNDSFNDKGEKPQFIYKRNPLVEYSFQIFMMVEEKGEYEPVGDYTVIDMDEDSELSEKKVMNVISILNGKDNLIELGNLTQTRVLFNIVPKKSEDDPTKIVFRNHDGKGTSEENAVLTINRGVLNDSQIRIPES